VTAPATIESTTAYDGALFHADRGHPVLPACGMDDDLQPTCGWTECPHPGKHPLLKRHLASSDPAQLAEWAERWSCNFALPLDHDLFVLDFDGPQGVDSFGLLVGEHGPLTDDPRYLDGVAVRSGNGYHVYLGVPDGPAIPSSAGRLGPGTEVKARASNIHVAGSRHPSGRLYEWIDSPPNGSFPLPRRWLLDLILAPPSVPRASTTPIPPPTDPERAERYGLGGLQRELDDLAATEEGGRNLALNKAAFSVGQLVAGGCLNYEYAVGELMRVALETRLPVAEIEGTIRSGMSAGAKNPRSVET
jgi:hypothetical protein